jgi:hypothetical protein
MFMFLRMFLWSRRKAKAPSWAASGPSSSVKRNAPLDPLGEKPMTPAEIVTLFHVLRAPFLTGGIDRIPKFEDVRATAPEAFFTASDLPAAIVFISHRWESPAHPDPTGVQLKALVRFLDHIKAFSSALAGETDELDECRQLMFTHGGFQAAYFLAEANVLDPTNKQPIWEHGSRVLAKLGIWYDYSCMAQDGLDQAGLVASLKHIHQLINASTFLAVRKAGDGFDGRAWCAAEVSVDADIDRTQCKKMVLRLDQLDQEISERTLLEGPRICFQ